MYLAVVGISYHPDMKRTRKRQHFQIGSQEIKFAIFIQRKPKLLTPIQQWLECNLT